MHSPAFSEGRRKLIGVVAVLFAFLLLFSLLWLAVKLKESGQEYGESLIQDLPFPSSPAESTNRSSIESQLSPLASARESETPLSEKKILSDARKFSSDFVFPEVETKLAPSHIHSSVRQAVNSFLQKFLKLGGFPSLLQEAEWKGSPEKQKQALSLWAGTRKFGFEFESTPPAADWKITESSRELDVSIKKPARDGSSAIFLKAENDWAGAELFFAALAKDPVRAYSEQLSTHWVTAEKLAQRIGQELSLKNLKLFQQETKFFPNSKFLQIKISGLDEKKNIRFKGQLFFFQTPTHFVGAMLMPKKMPQNFNFNRVERLLAEMFQKIFFTSTSIHLAGRTRTEPAETVSGGNTESSESSAGRHQRPPPLFPSKREVGTPALSKMRKEEKKAWERGTEIGSNYSDRSESEHAGRLAPSESRFLSCPTCSGKSRCSNQNCDGGFILCELCKTDPPPKCRKCRASGLQRVDNPFTRTETWGYCDRCYGTGKKICKNNCRGGKLRCKVCEGTGLCPDCKGRGYLTR